MGDGAWHARCVAAQTPILGARRKQSYGRPCSSACSAPQLARTAAWADGATMSQHLPASVSAHARSTLRESAQHLRCGARSKRPPLTRTPTRRWTVYKFQDRASRLSMRSARRARGTSALLTSQAHCYASQSSRARPFTDLYFWSSKDSSGSALARSAACRGTAWPATAARISREDGGGSRRSKRVGGEARRAARARTRAERRRRLRRRRAHDLVASSARSRADLAREIESPR